MKPDINALMQEAKKMQERMQQAQKELETLIVIGEAGAGMIKIEMTGRYEVKKVTINDDMIDEDITMVEDLIAAAVNDAVRKVEQETRGRMAGLTAGLDLPSDMGGNS